MSAFDPFLPLAQRQLFDPGDEVEAVAESEAGLVPTQGDWLKGKPAFAVIPQ